MKLALEDWFAVSAQWDESEYEAYLAREGTIVGRRNGAGRKSSRYWFEESLHHYKCFLWSVNNIKLGAVPVFIARAAAIWYTGLLSD